MFKARFCVESGSRKSGLPNDPQTILQDLHKQKVSDNKLVADGMHPRFSWMPDFQFDVYIDAEAAKAFEDETSGTSETCFLEEGS